MARAKIDKHVLDELKSLSSPPENVKETLSVAVAVVNKEKPPKEWKDVQKALSNSGFVKAIQAHDDTVAKEAAPALKKYAAKHKLEDIKSKAAAFLAAWLLELAGSGAAGPTKESNPREWTIFEQIDLNGNGSLDMDEVRMALEKLGEETTAQQLLAKLDTNGDGVITFDEFVTGFSAAGFGKLEG